MVGWNLCQQKHERIEPGHTDLDSKVYAMRAIMKERQAKRSNVMGIRNVPGHDDITYLLPISMTAQSLHASSIAASDTLSMSGIFQAAISAIIPLLLII